MNPFEIIRPTVARDLEAPAAPVRLDPGDADAARRDPPYVLSDELATAINVALTLDQPLLVTGEPGCGKTTLAWAVARQLGTDVLPFHVKSTSTARDLFYTVDSLRRFHDASAGVDAARDASNYLAYQALGEAIRSERSLVVLIDEIDKAPRDFPNDLLNEIDRMEFQVPEVSPPLSFRQSVRHFVLVTSNSERRLPMPFLRRCVYAHVDFPTDEALRRIVALHVPEPSDAFVAVAVRRFLELRTVPGLVKRPATSELIGWVRVLQRMEVAEETLEAAKLGDMPAIHALVKMLDDLEAIRSKSR